MSFTSLPAAGVPLTASALSSLITEVRGLYAVKTGDTARTNNTLSDDPHLSISAAANTVYELDGVLRYTCASATPDLQVVLVVPAGATAYMAPVGASPALASQVGTGSWYSPASGSAVNLGSNDNASFPALVRLGGWVSIAGTSGNVKIQWAQVSTNASAVTFLTGSYMTLRQLV